MLTDDVVAIEQLLYRYCFAVDKGTADDVAGPVPRGRGPDADISAIRPPKAALRSANGMQIIIGNCTRPWSICATA